MLRPFPRPETQARGEDVGNDFCYEGSMAKQKPKLTNSEQSKRFIEAAKKAEVDETEAGAERAFKKVAGKLPRKPSK
jgi:hypothetical protein